MDETADETVIVIAQRVDGNTDKHGDGNGTRPQWEAAGGLENGETGQLEIGDWLGQFMFYEKNILSPPVL